MSTMMDSKENKTGQALVEQLKAFYEDFNPKNLQGLDGIYTQDVEFVDPIEVTKGLFALKHYFRTQGQNLNYSRFRYISELVGQNQAFIRWEMVFSHPRLNKGKEIVVPGMSELHFTQKIYFQQDSYDLGAMLYEHIPLLGYGVKKLKSRLAP